MSKLAELEDAERISELMEDNDRLSSTIAEQAATIGRLREVMRLEASYHDAIRDNDRQKLPGILVALGEALSRVTKADMGEAEENADDVFFDIQEDERRRFEAGLP